MARKMVPCVFWSMVVLCLALVMGEQWRAFGQSTLGAPTFPDTWDGFFVDTTNAVGGLTHLEFSPMKNRRLELNGSLTLDRGALYNSYNCVAVTLAQDDFYVGTGPSRIGRVQIHGGLSVIDGGAALSELSSHFVPFGQPGGAQVSSILLHSFPNGGNTPTVGGVWSGTVGSPSDAFAILVGQIRQSPDALNRFDGMLTLRAGADQPPLVFDLIGTVNGSGRIALISQGNDGRLTAQGIIGTSPQRGAFGDAQFQLRLFNGQTLFNAWNFSVMPDLE
jgi:hypothetical protein